jgi:hypothetical protein
MAHEYTFDVKLFAVIRVKATSEAEARAMIEDAFDGSEVRYGEGTWPNGDPILFGSTQDEPENDELLEIDGEAV